MSNTTLADVQDQIQKMWAPTFAAKLKEETLLPSLVAKDYDGQMNRKMDTVYVSAIDNMTATRKNVNDADASNYSTQKLSTTRIPIVADTIIEAGVIVESLAEIQSQLDQKQSEIRQKMFEAMDRELNAYLYEKVAPSAAAPDHIIDGVTDFNLSQLSAVRTNASIALWPALERFLLLDPTYYGNFLDVVNNQSSDHVPDAPLISGRVVNKRYGFNVIEDATDGMKNVSPTLKTSQLGLAFIPEFIQFVMQQEMVFKISDLHPQEKRGYLLTGEMLVGSAQGIEGDVKHQIIYNT